MILPRPQALTPIDAGLFIELPFSTKLAPICNLKGGTWGYEKVHPICSCSRVPFLSANSHGSRTRPIHRGRGNTRHPGPDTAWTLQCVHGRSENEHQADLGCREESWVNRRLQHLSEYHES